MAATFGETLNLIDDPAPLLRDAVELIREPDMWGQGQMHDGHGHRCAMGAIAHAIELSWQAGKHYGFRATDSAIRAVNAAALVVNPERYGIVDLNDRGTHGDVILAFKHAIAACEGT